MDDQVAPDAARRRNRRDPEGHRAAVLAAAREAFSERGYAGTTLREIARRAGVSHGLIRQQFSSKEQLFLAAVPGNSDLETVAAGDPETLPERIAHGFVQRMETGAAGDPLITVLRSAASDERTATGLLAAMQQHSIDVYRSVLRPDSAGGTDDLDTRVTLVGAQLIGVTFIRYIARTEPLASMPPDQLATELAGVLRHILFD
jgi:AcrR family transcriptional regulator